MLLRLFALGTLMLAVPTAWADDISTVDVARAEQQRLLQQKCAELDRLQREIQQLRAATGTAQQILVKVEMLEVDLTKMRKLGMDLGPFTNGYSRGAKQRQELDIVGVRANSRTAGPAARKEADGSLLFVDALKQNNLAKVLAEPNIVVVSGRAGSFNVGGEFPIPANGDAKAAVQFRKFGTELNLVALALGDNRVRLEVRTRVSEIDDANALVINGARIPRLNVRECDTSSELTFGQSAVLSGLVQQRTESVRDKDGQIKEEPADFGLLVVITPEIVD